MDSSQGYQKCPICEGSGREDKAPYSGAQICSICLGEKIIHVVTGMPPTKMFPTFNGMAASFKKIQELLEQIKRNTDDGG